MSMLDRPSWDDYFMEIAHVISTRSPDPHTKIGSVIVNQSRQIIATGYNGWIGEYNTDNFPLSREADEFGLSKYSVILHSEMNALLQLSSCSQSGKGATIYCTCLPCLHCLQSIIQAKLTEIVYPKGMTETAKFGIKPETKPYYDLIFETIKNKVIIRELQCTKN